MSRLVPWVLLLLPIVAQAEQFKLGMVVCLTGPCASDGQSAIDGAQLAADEINGKGGVLGRTISLVAEDTAEAISGARAVTAYRSLRQDPAVTFFIGPSWTPGGLALAPIVAKERGVVITTPSLGVGEFHEAGDNIFNARGVDETASRMSARLAIERGWKRAAVFSSEQPWESLQGKFFEEEYKKLGGVITAKVEPLPSITNLDAEAMKVVTSKPDVIFFSNVVQLGIASRAVRRYGYAGKKLIAYMDEVRNEEAQGALDGAEFYSFQTPSADFNSKFESRFKRKPELPAGTSYDTVYAYAKAIEKGNSFDPEVVKRELLTISLDSSAGKLEFDSKGCAKRPIKLLKVEGERIITAER